MLLVVYIPCICGWTTIFYECYSSSKPVLFEDSIFQENQSGWGYVPCNTMIFLIQMLLNFLNNCENLGGGKSDN